MNHPRASRRYDPTLIQAYLDLFSNHQRSADDLILALTAGEYSRAGDILEALEKPLSATDAEIAVLCAMNGPEDLLDALLEHCPPIPELLPNTTLMYEAISNNNADMLDFFLRRGADPNGEDLGIPSSLLSYAFCQKAAACLKRLLEEPSLHLVLTGEMLQEWGRLGLHDGKTGPAFLRCCHLLLNALGVPAEPDAPYPIPPQLRLRHALHYGNFKLAAHICRLRPLTGEEEAEVLDFYSLRSSHSFFPILPSSSGQPEYAQFLDVFLQRCPHLLPMPKIRTEVVRTALYLPEGPSPLMHWIERMNDGPVLLPSIPLRLCERFQRPAPDEEFITRWTNHLSPRLISAVDANCQLPRSLTDDDFRILLPWLHVAGKRPAGKVSAVAQQVLERAPIDLLPILLQEGKLLAEEDFTALLHACDTLPTDRRGCLLAHLNKNVDYSL